MAYLPDQLKGYLWNAMVGNITWKQSNKYAIGHPKARWSHCYCKPNWLFYWCWKWNQNKYSKYVTKHICQKGDRFVSEQEMCDWIRRIRPKGLPYSYPWRLPQLATFRRRNLSRVVGDTLRFYTWAKSYPLLNLAKCFVMLSYKYDNDQSWYKYATTGIKKPHR